MRQNWTAGMDPKGRPRPASGIATSVGTQGKLLYPGVGGGTNWWSPSYDPARDLVFVNTLERSMYFYDDATDTFPMETGTKFFTAVRALSAADARSDSQPRLARVRKSAEHTPRCKILMGMLAGHVVQNQS